MELDSRAKIHLEWMFENQPELVRQLHQENKLEEVLEAKYQQALELTDRLKQERGLSEDEAFEIASYLILAPPDGRATSDHPPEPLPSKERQQIYARLDARELANRRKSARQDR